MNIVIRKNGDGFLAIEKSIQGAFAEGNTEKEAEEELGHVIKMIEEYKASRNK